MALVVAAERAYAGLAAEAAYAEAVTMDRKVELLRSAASGARSGPELEAALARSAPAALEMPETAAVLRSLPAKGDFPGAQFRLAGDRCGSSGDVPSAHHGACLCVVATVGCVPRSMRCVELLRTGESEQARPRSKSESITM